MVAIGLQKPNAKMKVGESCTCMRFIDLAVGCCYRIKITGIHLQDQITEQESNNNQILNGKYSSNVVKWKHSFELQDLNEQGKETESSQNAKYKKSVIINFLTRLCC
jgi:hypothetical protein